MKKFAVLVFALAWFANARCEIYMGLTPAMSVVKVKEKYPNATLTDLKPAWLAPNQSSKLLTGSGIIGQIFLIFSHLDASNEAARSAIVKKIEENPNGDNASNQKMVDMYSGVLNAPLDERLTLDWVRWLPPSPVPYERLVSKYGAAEKCDYKADTFEPYCAWTTRGIFAVLDDKKIGVTSIEFTFTADEWGKVFGIPKASGAQPLKPKAKVAHPADKPVTSM